MHWGMIERLGEYRKLADGRCYVIGVEKSDNENFIVGFYDNEEEALKIAEKKIAQEYETSGDNAMIIYLTYNRRGKYIGAASGSEI